MGAAYRGRMALALVATEGRWFIFPALTSKRNERVIFPIVSRVNNKKKKRREGHVPHPAESAVA